MTDVTGVASRTDLDTMLEVSTVWSEGLVSLAGQKQIVLHADTSDSFLLCQPSFWMFFCGGNRCVSGSEGDSLYVSV